MKARTSLMISLLMATSCCCIHHGMHCADEKEQDIESKYRTDTHTTKLSRSDRIRLNQTYNKLMDEPNMINLAQRSLDLNLAINIASKLKTEEERLNDEKKEDFRNKKIDTWEKRIKHAELELDYNKMSAKNQNPSIGQEERLQNLRRLAGIAATLKKVDDDSYAKTGKKSISIWAKRAEDVQTKIKILETHIKHQETVKQLDVQHKTITSQLRNPQLSLEQKRELLKNQHTVGHSLRTELQEIQDPIAQERAAQLLEQSCILNATELMLAEKDKQLKQAAQATIEPKNNAEQSTITIPSTTASTTTVVAPSVPSTLPAISVTPAITAPIQPATAMTVTTITVNTVTTPVSSTQTTAEAAARKNVIAAQNRTSPNENCTIL